MCDVGLFIRERTPTTIILHFDMVTIFMHVLTTITQITTIGGRVVAPSMVSEISIKKPYPRQIPIAKT